MQLPSATNPIVRIAVVLFTAYWGVHLCSVRGNVPEFGSVCADIQLPCLRNAAHPFMRPRDHVVAQNLLLAAKECKSPAVCIAYKTKARDRVVI
jgi:hypothetical protein